MITWGDKTYVMGILNLTPDSFSGDSILLQNDPVQFALEKAREFVAQGAHILDIGAESSRPGSAPISANEELDRLIPVIQAIKQEKIPSLLSIDTYKAEVAETCLDIGVDWINDIWALQKDARIAAVVAQYDVPVVLMHNRSTVDAVETDQRLGSSYEADLYNDFLNDIIRDLQAIANNAIRAGVRAENIILDPGIGFGKTVNQNLQLINCLDRVKAIGYPILIGPSRKSFIGKTLNLPVEERLEGTTAAIALGIVRGADIIRVHDVRSMARVAAMTDALLRATCQEN
jgi:dihydropteroate synthase